jgi:hypothetical protein
MGHGAICKLAKYWDATQKELKVILLFLLLSFAQFVRCNSERIESDYTGGAELYLGDPVMQLRKN